MLTDLNIENATTRLELMPTAQAANGGTLADALARGRALPGDEWPLAPDDVLAGLLVESGLRPRASGLQHDGLLTAARARFKELVCELPPVLQRRLDHVWLAARGSRADYLAANYVAVTFASGSRSAPFAPCGWMNGLDANEMAVALRSTSDGWSEDRQRLGQAWCPLQHARALVVSRRRWAGSGGKASWRLDVFGLWQDEGGNLRIGGHEPLDHDHYKDHHYFRADVGGTAPTPAYDPLQLATRYQACYQQALDMLFHLELTGSYNVRARKCLSWPRIALGLPAGEHEGHAEKAKGEGLFLGLASWADRRLTGDLRESVDEPSHLLAPFYGRLFRRWESAIQDGHRLTSTDIEAAMGRSAFAELVQAYRRSCLFRADGLEWLPADHYRPGAAPEGRLMLVLRPDQLGQDGDPLLAVSQVVPLGRRGELQTVLCGRVGRVIYEMTGK
jgi:hypothetical protein